MKGGDSCTATADWSAGIGVRPNHQNGLDLCLIERQQPAVIFEQYDAFARLIESNCLVG